MSENGPQDEALSDDEIAEAQGGEIIESEGVDVGREQDEDQSVGRLYAEES